MKPPFHVVIWSVLLLLFIALFAFRPAFFVPLISASNAELHSIQVVTAGTAATVSRNSVPAETSASILAVGDIMLGRNVETLMNIYGSDYPFAHIHDFLMSADMSLANLEGPIVENHIQTPDMGFQFSFPPADASVLRKEGIGIVSLANNHTYNYGQTGFSDTVRFLDQAGVAHFGNPNVFSDAYVLRKTISGQNFMFVGLNATDPSFDPEAAAAFIKELHRNQSDFLIVMMHGGTEYSDHSNEFQENAYRTFIDAGADVVIGAHPHVVEEIEEYHGHLIFYSLGNFIFDQYFSHMVQQGLAVKLTVSIGGNGSNNRTVRYDLIPINGGHSQPSVMDTASKTQFLTSIASTSSPSLQSSIQNGSILMNW